MLVPLTLQAGVSAERLVQVCKTAGFPVDVIALYDEVGLDVVLHVVSYLTDVFGVRLGTKHTTAVAVDAIAENMLGKWRNI